MRKPRLGHILYAALQAFCVFLLTLGAAVTWAIDAGKTPGQRGYSSFIVSNTLWNSQLGVALRTAIPISILWFLLVLLVLRSFNPTSPKSTKKERERNPQKEKPKDTAR
jgi:hypothetical protein